MTGGYFHMSTTTSTQSSPEAVKSTRSGRFRAILAGGLVLGVGAAVVLAAWNDSEFGSGAFTAGAFNLEGSLDGAVYADHPTSDAAAPFTFAVNPENLAPGDTVYAPFAVRLDGSTTSPATVTINSVATGANAANLTYALTTPGAFGCDASDAGAPLVPAATPVTATPAGVTFPLATGAGPAAGSEVNLCFKVTAGAALSEGDAAVVTWEFAATSIS